MTIDAFVYLLAAVSAGIAFWLLFIKAGHKKEFGR